MRNPVKISNLTDMYALKMTIKIWTIVVDKLTGLEEGTDNNYAEDFYELKHTIVKDIYPYIGMSGDCPLCQNCVRTYNYFEYREYREINCNLCPLKQETGKDCDDECSLYDVIKDSYGIQAFDEALLRSKVLLNICKDYLAWWEDLRSMNRETPEDVRSELIFKTEPPSMDLQELEIRVLAVEEDITFKSKNLTGRQKDFSMGLRYCLRPITKDQ